MPIPIEQTFDEVVKQLGGELISEFLLGDPKFENADYLFRDRCVIAELKCLEKDFLKTENYVAKLSALYAKWVRKRLVPPVFGTRQVESKNLPLVCQREVTSLIKKPIEQIIKKANRQIREAKKYLGLASAKGLLILANDGNYGLETDNIAYFVSKTLSQSCSSINSVIFFTANMPAAVPWLPELAHVWVAGHTPLREGVQDDFLDQVRNAWLTQHAEIAGHPIRLYEAGFGNVSVIRWVRRKATSANK